MKKKKKNLFPLFSFSPRFSIKIMKKKTSYCHWRKTIHKMLKEKQKQKVSVCQWKHRMTTNIVEQQRKWLVAEDLLLLLIRSHAKKPNDVIEYPVKWFIERWSDVVSKSSIFLLPIEHCLSISISSIVVISDQCQNDCRTFQRQFLVFLLSNVSLKNQIHLISICLMIFDTSLSSSFAARKEIRQKRKTFNCCWSRRRMSRKSKSSRQSFIGVY